MLFREYIRLAKTIQPKVIFFENVYGIMNMQGGKVLDAIVSEFREIGYQCKYDLVNAADFGVPQARPRFVLIGARGFDKTITFPKPTHGKVEETEQLGLFERKLLPYVTVNDAFSNLPVVDQGEGAEEREVAISLNLRLSNTLHPLSPGKATIWTIDILVLHETTNERLSGLTTMETSISWTLWWSKVVLRHSWECLRPSLKWPGDGM